MADVLPWLNLLLVPVVGLLVNVSRDLGGIIATQRDHARRLDRLEAARR